MSESGGRRRKWERAVGTSIVAKESSETKATNFNYAASMDVDEDAKNIFSMFDGDEVPADDVETMRHKQQIVMKLNKLLKRMKRLAEKSKLKELLATLVAHAEFLEQLQERSENRKLCRVIASASIAAVAKCRDLALAMTLLKKAEGPFACGVSSAAYSSVIIEAGRAGDLDLALTLLDWWKKGRGPRSYTRFDASTNRRKGKIFTPNSFSWTYNDVPQGINRKDRIGIEWYPRRTSPSRMLFCVLDACAECGDISRAIETKNEILALFEKTLSLL